MADRMAGTVVHLERCCDGEAKGGLATMLQALDRMKATGETCLRINCRHIAATDVHTLNFLLDLFECARLRGIEPKLVDLADDIKSVFYALGPRHCFLIENQNNR